MAAVNLWPKRKPRSRGSPWKQILAIKQRPFKLTKKKKRPTKPDIASPFFDTKTLVDEVNAKATKEAKKELADYIDDALLRNTAINTFSGQEQAPSEEQIRLRVTRLKERQLEQIKQAKFQKILNDTVARLASQKR